MKTAIHLIAALVCMFLSTTATQAQNALRSVPEHLAELLSQEKASGVINNNGIAAYLDTLGFEKVDSESDKTDLTYVKQLQKGSSEEVVFIKLTIGFKVSANGIKTRFISVTADDKPLLLWVISKLKDFGLFQTEGEGDCIDMKGKGLTAGTSPNSVTLRYQMQETETEKKL